jgi:membrane protein YqaA with SNARE-associated domain
MPWTLKLLRLLIVVVVLGISIAIFAFRDQFAALAAIGYPGIFLVSMLGCATIILPAPSLALVFAMGTALPPMLVGLAAGAGETVGEITGYLAGFGGRAVIEDQKLYARLEEWMIRRGDITIFLLSVIPNPVFDIAGIAAGTLRFPLWRFMLISLVGKTIKTTFVAWAGAHSLTMIQPLLD